MRYIAVHFLGGKIILIELLNSSHLVRNGFAISSFDLHKLRWLNLAQPPENGRTSVAINMTNDDSGSDLTRGWTIFIPAGSFVRIRNFNGVVGVAANRQ